MGKRRQERAARSDDLPQRGSLYEAAITTEAMSFRSEAEELVGELIAEIEGLDGDAISGPAVGVGLGPLHLGGVGYWEHVRRLITTAIGNLSCFSEERLRLLGKVAGVLLGSLRASADLTEEEFKRQVGVLDRELRRRFDELEPVDDDGDSLDYDDQWMLFMSGISAGVKHPRRDLLDIANSVRKEEGAKRSKAAAIDTAAKTTMPDTAPAQSLPNVPWPDKVGVKDPIPDPKSQDNVRAFLKFFGLELWRDSFANENLIDGFDTEHGDGRMSDTVADRLWLMMCDAGCRMDYTLFVRYLGALAAFNTRHPIRDYLSQCKWDRGTRVEELFIKYLGADDSPLNRAYAKAFMVAAVRRVRQPGCELYGVPILEGFEGGEGKSRFAKTLFGAQYHTDALELGASPKEVLEIASGKWGIEFSELDGLTTNREFSTIKAMITRAEDRARKAYGRFTSSQPRQFVMMGTTNDGAYLRDRGGLRRFWPITVRPGVLAEKLPELEKDRDQLWAEAAYLEAQGASHNIPEELWQQAKADQQNRVIADPVEEWLTPLFESMPAGFLPVDQIKRAFDDDEFDYDRSARSGVVARVARKLGLERSERKIPSTRQKVRGFLKGGDRGRGKWLEHRFRGTGFTRDEQRTQADPEDDSAPSIKRPNRAQNVVTMTPSKKRIMQQLGVSARAH
jgi:hypothetical protein